MLNSAVNATLRHPLFAVAAVAAAAPILTLAAQLCGFVVGWML